LQEQFSVVDVVREEALRIYRFAETTTRKGTKRANGTGIKLKKSYIYV